MPNVKDHKTFCAFGAKVINDRNRTAIEVLPLAYAQDTQQQLVPLDFTKLLGAVPWDQVILDHVGLEQDGSAKRSVNTPQRSYNAPGIDVLSVGPTFPGPTWGGIYMERTLFFAQVRPHLGSWPYAGEAYSYMSSAAWNGGAIRRYHGFHATVTKDMGSTKQLDIEIPGSAQTVTVTVDLSDRDQCDDPDLLAGQIEAPGQSTGKKALEVTSPVGDKGAIFLALKLCAPLNLRGPKQPPNG
jgi:hypothetical protein